MDIVYDPGSDSFSIVWRQHLGSRRYHVSNVGGYPVLPAVPVVTSKESAYVDLLHRLITGYRIHRVQKGNFYIAPLDYCSEPIMGPDDMLIKMTCQALHGTACVPVRISPIIKSSSQFLPVRPAIDYRDIAVAYSSYMRTNLPWSALIYDSQDRTTSEVGFDVDPKPFIGGVRSLRQICTDVVRSEHRKGLSIHRSVVSPCFYRKYSFVSAGTSTGVSNVLKRLSHDIFTPQVDAHEMTAAYLNLINIMHPIALLNACVDPCVDGVDKSKSAGINLYKRGEQLLDGIIYRYIWRSNKELAEDAALLEARTIVDGLKKMEPDRLRYYGQYLRATVDVAFCKPEIRDPWADQDKARLIFICSYLQYLLDKTVFEGAMKQLYGMPPIGIGWSKSHGGVHQLMQHLLSAEDDYCEWFSYDGDFEKLDFTMIAPLILMAASALLYSYNPDSEFYAVFKYLFSASVESLISKYLHLFDGVQYLIIGMMFSGRYLTSMGDTLYVSLAVELWYQHVAEQLSPADYEHWVNCWPLRNYVYGDDIIGVLPSYVYPYFVGKPWDQRSPHDKPVYFSNFLKRSLNLVLKMSESHVFFGRFCGLLSVPDSFGELSVVGPKYLQRYFILCRDEQNVDEDPDRFPTAFVPYRPTSHYYVKASRSITGPCISYWIMKLRGLMVDTCGFNPHAYAFLRHLHDVAVQLNKTVKFKYKLDLYDPDELYRRIKDTTFLCSGVANSCPTNYEIYDEYWPRYTWHQLSVHRRDASGLYPYSDYFKAKYESFFSSN